MSKSLVIDSNCLQSARLEAFLSDSVHNKAVLTDYAAMEAYQRNSIDSIVERMSVLALYPNQVIVLKGTKNVCGLRGRQAGLVKRMIDREATEQFAEFCQAIRLGKQGDSWFRSQIKQREQDAVRHLSLVQDGGADMARHYSVFETQFSASELRDIRVGNRLSVETLKKFIQLVAAFAGSTFEEHPNTGKWPAPNEWPYTFIYRSAILHYCHFFQWIKNGSPKSINPKRVRNDLIDLNFATYATFFDGLMTDDVKLEGMHAEALTYLHGLFIPALSRVWEDQKYANEGKLKRRN